MSRHFGIMSGPASLRGSGTDRPASGAKQYNCAGSEIHLPSGSILPLSPRAPLKLIDISEALLNCLAVLGVGLFILSAAVAVTVGIFVALFVRL